MDQLVNEQALEAGLTAVERGRSWSPRVISKLEHSIRSSPDEGLFRLDPLQWATERGVDEYESIDLFLYGAKAGLFEMDWNVICPCCGRVLRSLRELHGLESRNTCTVCFRKERSTLDDYVQVTFTISPSIRPIRYHSPDTLSLDDFCFTYLFEPGVRVGGVLTAREAMRLFRRHLSMFAPGERVTVDTTADPGLLSCTDLNTQHSFALLAQGEPNPETLRLSVAFTDRGFEVPLPIMQPGEFNLGSFEYEGTFYRVRPGPVVIEFEHQARAQARLLVIYFPVFGFPEGFRPPEEAATLAGPLQLLGSPNATYATPRLTAKRLFATQAFHDLFRAEVFRESEGFSVKDVTILFTDLKGSTQLYQREGDLNAYALVRQHYGILHHAVFDHHGAVIKTIGDAIMATFDRPVDAVAAGLEMLRELPQMNRTSEHGDLVLKVGIHRGAAISVTLNDRIDYFGQTVNLAARVQGSADGGELLLTEEIYTSDGVDELLRNSEWSVDHASTQLRGIEDPITIYKVSSP